MNKYNIKEPQRLWKKFYNKNNYYHLLIQDLAMNLIPKDASVVEFGCRGGELLSFLPNKNKVGVTEYKEFNELAKKRYKKLSIFEEKEFWKKNKNKKYDIILLSNVLSEKEDIQKFLKKLKKISKNDTKVIVVYFNYLWKFVLDLTQIIGLRMPYLKEPNWISDSDTTNFFYLEDMEIVSSGKKILIPINLSFISTLTNKYLSVLPIFNNFSLINYSVFRYKIQSPDTSVSIIIPVRNEEKNVVNLLKKIPKFGKKQEVIFIEGHSKDNTLEKVKNEIKNYKGDIKVYVYKQKGIGKADALRYGFSKAKNDLLMILDGDLTVRPIELSKFYDAIIKSKGDLIIGSRLIYPMESQAMRLLNIIGNKFFSTVFSFLLNQRIKDTLCGTKVIYKKNYLRIKKVRREIDFNDPFGDFDLIFGASLLNMKILEIPVRYKQRRYGETNIKRISHGFLLLKMTLVAAKKIKFN